eukprot:84466-Hanusia_phi.AAC.1
MLNVIPVLPRRFSSTWNRSPNSASSRACTCSSPESSMRMKETTVSSSSVNLPSTATQEVITSATLLPSRALLVGADTMPARWGGNGSPALQGGEWCEEALTVDLGSGEGGDGMSVSQ